MDIFPDFGAVGGAAELRSIAGALLTFVLIVAVHMMIISGITWALASASGHFQIATRARLGLWVAGGAAAHSPGSPPPPPPPPPPASSGGSARPPPPPPGGGGRGGGGAAPGSARPCCRQAPPR